MYDELTLSICFDYIVYTYFCILILDILKIGLCKILTSLTEFPYKAMLTRAKCLFNITDSLSVTNTTIPTDIRNTGTDS